MKTAVQPRRILAVLVAWHALLAVAAWMAPYPVFTQHREFPDAPPTSIRFANPDGTLAWPHVCGLTPHPEDFGHYVEDCSVRSAIRLFVPRSDGKLALFGVDEPGILFLLGSDEFGRDVFSRVLSGGLLSIGSGLAATLVALLLAAVLGGAAGFYGGFADALVSRAAEFLMALPLLYLLLAVRAALPIQTNPLVAFGIAVFVISVVGWARPARLVRGVVLSARERRFVLAARGFGASAPYLLRRHILPQTYRVLLAQAALLAPQFVLLEVTLSFFGLGVPEPTASWGTMLSSLRQYPTLASNWWIFSPAIALTISLLLFGSYAQAMENAGRQSKL